MCIALLSTAHPAYKLILIDNRDEYLNRPTAVASWWPSPHAHVFGGRDLLRSVQGTWLGVTKDGRVAVLTNFREDTTPPPMAVSRGEIIKKFLTEDVASTEEFAKEVVNQGVAKDAGGFSLVCGRVQTGKRRRNDDGVVKKGGFERLAVISNRAERGEEVPWICGDVVQTVGLSNASFGDVSWPKVVDGEVGLLDVIRDNVAKYPGGKDDNDDGSDDGDIDVDGEAEEDLIENLLRLLNDDALTRNGIPAEDGLETHIFELRKTILVPVLGRQIPQAAQSGHEKEEQVGFDNKPDEIAAARKGEVARILGNRNGVNTLDEANRQKLGVSGIYATQKQTVVLVDQNDRVRYLERTLFDKNCERVEEGKGTVDITFQIEDNIHA